VGVDCTDNFFREKAIEKTILRILRPSAFSHSLDPKRTLASASGSTKIKRSRNSLGAFSMTGRGFTRLLCVACAAALPFMLDALTLNSHRAFAQAAPASQGAGPRFRADGPNADEFGRKEGYPSCKGIAYVDETPYRTRIIANPNATSNRLVDE
jgi:hypothetical protein